ncbi:hypothetical protein [Haloimpatiens massiliensis]|uniref:hypothetical protein n=1 Tax=Haloimpatiens massiliensis TaxID=1658110 RepID=UPI000C838EFC|nr:hypothetical protein [Haloimpatiens massiliensis]
MNVINILLNIILICIVGQFATISHEFGHAIPALLFTKDNVKITFGNTVRKSKKIKFNRLFIEIGTFQPFLGIVTWSGDMLSKLKIIICSACGPMTSLLIAISLIYISGGINNNMLRKLISFSAYYHIWQFIFTAIPIIYPKWWAGYGGYPSDGYNIISAIKET